MPDSPASAASRIHGERAAPAGARIKPMRAASSRAPLLPNASAVSTVAVPGPCPGPCIRNCASSAAAYALRWAAGRPRSTSRSQPSSCAHDNCARSSRMKGLNQNSVCNSSPAPIHCRSRRRKCVASCSIISCRCNGSKPRRCSGSSKRGRKNPYNIGEIGASTSITSAAPASAPGIGRPAADRPRRKRRAFSSRSAA
jgi:hypothetical protein